MLLVSLPLPGRLAVAVGRVIAVGVADTGARARAGAANLGSYVEEHGTELAGIR